VTLLVLLMLAGCSADPPAGGDDDGTDDPVCPMDPGEPAVDIVTDDERHEPLTDGVEFAVRRQYQGAIATEIGIRWTGVDGGDPVGRLSATITTDDGAVVAERSFDDVLAPCDAHGGVGYHGLEVFYAYGGPMPEVDGLEATLEITAGDLHDSVRGVLRVE
jgi:hypothetical protein